MDSVYRRGWPSSPLVLLPHSATGGLKKLYFTYGFFCPYVKSSAGDDQDPKSESLFKSKSKFEYKCETAETWINNGEYNVNDKVNLGQEEAVGRTKKTYILVNILMTRWYRFLV